MRQKTKLILFIGGNLFSVVERDRPYKWVKVGVNPLAHQYRVDTFDYRPKVEGGEALLRRVAEGGGYAVYESVQVGERG